MMNKIAARVLSNCKRVALYAYDVSVWRIAQSSMDPKELRVRKRSDVKADCLSISAAGIQKSIMLGVAFDVGAFSGNSIPRLTALGFDNIICFEPVPQNYRALFRRNRRKKGIYLITKAASSKSGAEIEMYVNKHLPWLNTAHKDWIAGTRHERFVKSIRKICVQTITLDDAIEKCGFVPEYIKIDVEGHEIEVLNGLSYAPKILSFEWISERLPAAERCIEKCVALGFSRFVVMNNEAVPLASTVVVSAAEAKVQLHTLMLQDKDNVLGGNVWCFS